MDHNEHPPLPKLGNGIYRHPTLGDLYDTTQVHQRMVAYVDADRAMRAQAAPAAVAGPSEIVKFTDQSTADPVEKARRYLKAMVDQRTNSAYFFDDGYPRRESAQDALATLVVLEQLAAAPASQAAPQPAAQQGDALTYEQAHAIRQGHEIASSDAYFKARPQIDCLDRRNVFRAGFERGWDAALSQPVAQGDAEDAARLRFLIALMESAKGSASLTVNDHLSVYEQATPGEEVLLHWYPDSPVGFYEATGSTVREVIDSVRSQQGSKNV